MSEKSHVSVERHLCLACGAAYDTGTILLDRRLRARLERYTTTGWGLCLEHQRLFDDGFVALVECDPGKSGHPSSADRLKPDQAYRTGRVLHLKRMNQVDTRQSNLTPKPSMRALAGRRNDHAPPKRTVEFTRRSPR